MEKETNQLFVSDNLNFPTVAKWWQGGGSAWWWRSLSSRWGRRPRTAGGWWSWLRELAERRGVERSRRWSLAGWGLGTATCLSQPGQLTGQRLLSLLLGMIYLFVIYCWVCLLGPIVGFREMSLKCEDETFYNVMFALALLSRRGVTWSPSQTAVRDKCLLVHLARWPPCMQTSGHEEGWCPGWSGSLALCFTEYQLVPVSTWSKWVGGCWKWRGKYTGGIEGGGWEGRLEHPLMLPFPETLLASLNLLPFWQLSSAAQRGTSLGNQLEGEFAASTESAGLDRTDGSPRSLIVQQRERLRHEVLTWAMQRHPEREAGPVSVFQNISVSPQLL